MERILQDIWYLVGSNNHKDYYKGQREAGESEKEV